MPMNPIDPSKKTEAQKTQSSSDEMTNIYIRANHPVASIDIHEKIADIPERSYIRIKTDKGQFIYDESTHDFDFTPNYYSGTRSMTSNEIRQFATIAAEQLKEKPKAKELLAKMNADMKNTGRTSLDAHEELLPDNLRFNIADKNIRVSYERNTGKLFIMEYKTSVPESLSESKSESSPMRYDYQSGMYMSGPTMYRYKDVLNSKRIKVSNWEEIEDPIKRKNSEAIITDHLKTLRLSADDPRSELVKSLIEKLNSESLIENSE